MYSRALDCTASYSGVQQATQMYSRLLDLYGCKCKYLALVYCVTRPIGCGAGSARSVLQPPQLYILQTGRLYCTLLGLYRRLLGCGAPGYSSRTCSYLSRTASYSIVRLYCRLFARTAGYSPEMQAARPNRRLLARNAGCSPCTAAAAKQSQQPQQPQ